MYARRVNIPDEYDNEEKIPLPKDTMTLEDLEKQIEYMEGIVFPAIAERTRKINEEYRKKYDKKNTLVDIPIGTHVMVRLKSRPNKLAPLYEGPYTVVRRNKGGSYEVKDEQGELLHRNYTPSELKIVTIDESAIEEELFELEGIRDHRGSAGNREYLVKWVGYGERANTWQKAKDFSDPTIIQKYWRKVEDLRRLENERAEKLVKKSASSNKKKVTQQIQKKKETNVKKRKAPVTLNREERLLKRRAAKD
ncbi:hypothetical protein G6F56_011937 [Rhizopus delemar]|nr:hypothetical protein G6F56_011937 [Rhizopus delemar]